MGIPDRQRWREETRKPVVKQITAKDRKHAGDLLVRQGTEPEGRALETNVLRFLAGQRDCATTVSRALPPAQNCPVTAGVTPVAEPAYRELLAGAASRLTFAEGQ